MKPTFTRILALCLCTGLCAAAQQPDATVDHLRQDTSLVRSGIRPWHIRISFQLYDLEHKASRKGFVEEWFAGRDHFIITVDNPANEWPAVSTSTENPPNRNAFLIRVLLSDITNPFEGLGAFDAVGSYPKSQKVGGSTLNCLAITGTLPGVAKPTTVETACLEPASSLLRLIVSGNETMQRSAVGRFLQTQVPIDDAISFSSHIAITGHVDKLELWDTKANPKDLIPISPEEPIFLPEGISESLRTSSGTDRTQIGSTREFAGSSVNMFARIGGSSQPTEVGAISSPAITLTEECTRAMQRWNYASCSRDDPKRSCWIVATFETAPFLGID
jgi:hypothetical protein